MIFVVCFSRSRGLGFVRLAAEFERVGLKISMCLLALADPHRIPYLNRIQEGQRAI